MFDDRVVATVTTDASGFFVATFQVPLSNSGEHIIVATDGENTGRLNFTVKSITPTTPTPTPTSTSISTSTPTPIPTSTKNTTPPLSRNPYPDPDQMKRYVTPNDPAVQSLLQDILHNQIRIFSDFEALRDWASWHISYKYDRDVHGINEYWQLPSETLNLRTGDCEDFAILLCSLLRAYGIPSNQVYVAIGISSDGMHAYLVEKYYKGIWQVVEPQAGVWGGALMQDWFTSESYTELCCFNDQDYFKGSPTLPSGVYESEISTSFYPLTRGSGIAFKRQLEKGEKVTGSFEWMKDYPIIFSWGFTIYDPDGRIVLVENGLDLKHNFSFTPTISGIYTVELIKRDALSRCARFMFNPPDWIKN
jgi:transglutaminase-like putative cysteine protease